MLRIRIGRVLSTQDYWLFPILRFQNCCPLATSGKYLGLGAVAQKLPCSQHLRGKLPCLTVPFGGDQPRSSHDVLRCPHAGPAMIHGWLIGHGVIGLHLNRIVRRGWAIGAKDLVAAGIGTILHAT